MCEMFVCVSDVFLCVWCVWCVSLCVCMCVPVCVCLPHLCDPLKVWMYSTLVACMCPSPVQLASVHSWSRATGTKKKNNNNNNNNKNLNDKTNKKLKIMAACLFSMNLKKNKSIINFKPCTSCTSIWEINATVSTLISHHGSEGPWASILSLDSCHILHMQS